MAFHLTKLQRKELEEIGNLYRKTIYDPVNDSLPKIIKAFMLGLAELDSPISTAILPEVSRFYTVISSGYFLPMREKISTIRKDLSTKELKSYFTIILCRQKAWESALRKIIKYYFEGKSIFLYDIIALKVIIDSNQKEEDQEKMCYPIMDICTKSLTQHMCTLMPPTKIVGKNNLYKDYIAFPKENGYKSLHGAYMDNEKNFFEVQVRTQKMDADAEFGLNPLSEDNLSHTEYKNNEYKEIIPYIHFDPKKVNKPFFRCYLKPTDKNKKELIIVDKIGLISAKSVDERARTY